MASAITADGLPPAPVTLVAPADKAGLDTVSPTLSWNASAKATYYTLQIAGAADFVTIVTEQTPSGITITVPKGLLSFGQTYFWRVAAGNAGVISAWSPVFSFSTKKPSVTVTLTLVLGSTTMRISDSTGMSTTATLEAPATLGSGNRTVVPIRAIAEALGGQVGWNATARTATVTVGTHSLQLTIAKSTALLDGSSKQIDIDPKVVPVITNGRTMLPLRFVTESLGAQVAFDQSTNTITITYIRQ